MFRLLVGLSRVSCERLSHHRRANEYVRRVPVMRWYRVIPSTLHHTLALVSYDSRRPHWLRSSSSAWQKRLRGLGGGVIVYVPCGSPQTKTEIHRLQLKIKTKSTLQLTANAMLSHQQEGNQHMTIDTLLAMLRHRLDSHSIAITGIEETIEMCRTRIENCASDIEDRKRAMANLEKAIALLEAPGVT